ncbi:hypothetical protein BASA81_004140 [Batrachochytrium salamandrivorans]|nr:hypothetical protein BASA81_004140 [Batrachochytrium salamandrivorans]
MKRGGASGGQDASKKFKVRVVPPIPNLLQSVLTICKQKSNLLLHQNSELALALKLSKQELAAMSASHRKSNDRLTNRISSLDRAWRAVNARICLTADNKRIPISNPNLILSRYILANVTLQQDEQTSDKSNGSGDEGDDDEEEIPESMNEDEFERELKRRTEDTFGLFRQVLEGGGNSNTPMPAVAREEVLAARIELLREKLIRSRTQTAHLTTLLEEEKNNTWRLTRRLEQTSSTLSLEAPLASFTPQLPSQASPPPPPTAPPPLSYQQAATAAAVAGLTTQLEQQALVLQETTQLAANRLEEIQHLQTRNQQLVQEQQLRNSSISTANATGGVSLEIIQRLVDQRELRTGRTAEEAADRLEAYEGIVQELSKASLVISTSQASQVKRENQALRQEVSQLRYTVSTLQQLSSCSAANEELIALLRNENKTMQQRLQSREGAKEEDDDGLIGEIESLNHALNVSRDAHAKLQAEFEEQLGRWSEEKYVLERDLREMHEEKNMHIVRGDKMQQILTENELFVGQLQQQMHREKQLTERAEELAKRSVEACESAIAKQDESQKHLDHVLGKLSGLQDMENQVSQAKLQSDQIEFELNRAKEEIVQLKRKLERAKVLQQELQSSSTNNGTSSSGQDIRLQAMTNALRCPVYPHLWKDCVITKCAHMFSRKCLEDNLANRSRRCPTCKNQYSKDDLLTLYLYQSN